MRDLKNQDELGSDGTVLDAESGMGKKGWRRHNGNTYKMVW